MAKRPQSQESGSWTLAEELLERGDPAFVDELRRIHDPDTLGPFAQAWYADRRPAARRLLLVYLDRPLNALRHEPLVKRLFKLAEATGDDEVMGRFLVLFDRSVRRRRRKTYRYDPATKKRNPIEVASVPASTAMPRPKPETIARLTARQREGYTRYRLFSVATRNYLRRRAWRYFRKLGRQHPERYLAAVRVILTRYQDADVADGLALLDNWGLVHILFHFSPALFSKPTGWTLAEGHTLAELTAAPIYTRLWQAGPGPLLDLLNSAPSRPVRQWAIHMLRRDHAAALAGLPLDQLIAWLAHPSSEMVALAVDILKTGQGLVAIDVERRLKLLASAAPESLEMLCRLVGATLQPDQVTIDQAVELARQRPLVLAQLGFNLLRAKTLTTIEEYRALLQLDEAEAPTLRPEMVRWSCSVLGASPHFTAAWVVDYLDSRHDDVRAEGWTWLQAEPRAHQDVQVWQRLLESPYDDIRLKLTEYLETQTADGKVRALDRDKLDPELVRFLWATVLLNVARGSRTKQAVVRQLVQRLDRQPGEAEQLLPILNVALRSLRGPEFRAGLLGVVQAARRRPGLEPLVRRLLPELQPADIITGQGATSG